MPPCAQECAKAGILVVEDNEDMRELAETTPESAGYGVLTALSGE